MYLLLLALAPAAFLLYYVHKKDSSEKEPPSLLAALFFAGVASCIPASIIEVVFGSVLSTLTGISDEATLESGGTLFVIYQFINNFLIVALAEEGVKFLAMYLITHKNRNFNSLFDGMIYAIFVSLGFAAFENILYVIDGGVSVALMRAVMSVPGHMFFAVFMGYYYSMWHIYKTADAVEDSLAYRGVIVKRGQPFEYKKYMVYAIVIPVLIHGFYDFCLSLGIDILIFVVLVLLIVLYIHCFNRIKKLSRADMEDYKLVPMLITLKYTELAGIAPTGDSPLSHTQLVEIAERRNKAEQQVQQFAGRVGNQQPYAQPQQPYAQPQQPYAQPQQPYAQPQQPYAQPQQPYAQPQQPYAQPQQPYAQPQNKNPYSNYTQYPSSNPYSNQFSPLEDKDNSI